MSGTMHGERRGVRSPLQVANEDRDLFARPDADQEATFQVQQDLGLVFARFGERLGRVIVAVSVSGNVGLTSREIEVQLEPKRVTVVCSDRDILVAVGYAARRAARSVSRAIDLERLDTRQAAAHSSCKDLLASYLADRGDRQLDP